MPRGRIPRHNTNMFKVRTVDDSRKARVRGDTCAEFARSRSIPRPTLQNWECKYARLLRESRRHPRVSSYLPPVPSRESCLTFSGSGRKADTAPIEGTLCIFIIDERGLEHIVTIDTIVKTATELMPIVMGPKNREAKQSWCQCFMRRNHPTIRRICHSGRKTRDELEELCLPFVEQVTEVAKDGGMLEVDVHKYATTNLGRKRILLDDRIGETTNVTEKNCMTGVYSRVITEVIIVVPPHCT